MSAIFELVDRTDDETYYPVGVFLSLQDAVAAVENNPVPWTLSEQSQYCDFCRLEIREREIGLSQYGRTVWSREWHVDYGAEDDEEGWKLTP